MQNAHDILDLLQQLQVRQVPITLTRQGAEPLNCCLISVDGAQAELRFEVRDTATGPTGKVPAVLQGEALSATAYLDRIPLQFDLAGVLSLSTAGAAGTEPLRLRSHLPALLYRFQRRQTFRVRPTPRTPHAVLQHPQQAAQQVPLRLRILDLSLGGLALWLPPEITPFEPGSLLPAVQVELNSGTRFQAAMQLQNSHTGDASGRQMGLSFAQINAAAERELQLYIEQIQRRTRLLHRA